MKSFEYAEPRTEEEAVELLQVGSGEAAVLAGGTDLMGLLKKMVVTPSRVVNIMEIASLKEIRRLDDGSLLVGTAVTLDELLAAPELSDYAAVTDAIQGINSMQLQCQGTFGGELMRRPQCWYFRQGGSLLDGDTVSQGDNRFHAIIGNSGPAKYVSASRLAPGLIALQAQVRLVGSSGERWSSLADLYQIPRRSDQVETALVPGELVTHLIVPPAAGVYNATYEVRSSEGPDAPLASAAAAIEFAGGAVESATIVMGQVAPIPWKSEPAADCLLGRPVSAELAEEAGRCAVARATPLSGNEFKVQLAATAVKRAILRAAGLETGGF